MRAFDLLDQSVSPQESKQARDLGTLPATLLRIVGERGSEQRKRVAVAKAVGDELAPSNTSISFMSGLLQGRSPRARRPRSPVGRVRGSTIRLERRVDGSVRKDVEVAERAGPADSRKTSQVGNALAQRQEDARAARVALCFAAVLELAWVAK